MDKDLMLMAAPVAAEIVRAKIAGGIDPNDATMLRNSFLNAYRAVDAAGQVIVADQAKRQLPPSPRISASAVLPAELG